MKKFVIATAVVVFGSSAFAAGIDPRAYTCAGLHALIAQQGFVYIGSPFQDFAVSNVYFCSGSNRLEPRSVATSDNPQCAIPYCEAKPNQDGRQ